MLLGNHLQCSTSADYKLQYRNTEKKKKLKYPHNIFANRWSYCLQVIGNGEKFLN